ncbi:hypothetical protein ALQ81_04829 [Pseudomonas syringae pv. pisi]|nr:hypothetical protein ALQ81_04829 [Pseudomonas syringae pv. pisi]
MVLDEIVMCAPHVIGEKMLAQQMAQANKELKAGIEVRRFAPPPPPMPAKASVFSTP